LAGPVVAGVLVGDGLLGDGLCCAEITELGRLTRQVEFVLPSGKASASPSAMYCPRFAYPAEV
jgi:hypothetical protein